MSVSRYINTLTLTERTKRDHELDCPPDTHGADDGEARQCPHGKWFVFRLSYRSSGPASTSRSGHWRPATVFQRYRIKKELR